MKEYVPVGSAVEQGARAGLREAGRAVLKASNAKAPKDDGDLIKSGRVVVDDLTVQVSYTAVHAPLQHENLDWKHDAGGGPKFLESAASEVDVGTILAEHVRKALGG
ncbi:hypothetical protein L332_03605 [Agrococcus pavilionensis RW1]|uniref:HK97 gp10 family phage protein n=1 Tax=Agrococcus pavilionensis RW1 TaxID=1330458 RepID=U1LNJ0_9MICO|nr:hypothetical protein [Agrococcus pavilionensis]ERG63537.1 hypothetical protein L332_03605 [Agrococcus pavilionensis RW1]